MEAWDPLQEGGCMKIAESGGEETFWRMLDSAFDRLRPAEARLCLDRLYRMERTLLEMEAELDALCAEKDVRSEVHGFQRR